MPTSHAAIALITALAGAPAQGSPICGVATFVLTNPGAPPLGRPLRPDLGTIAKQDLLRGAIVARGAPPQLASGNLAAGSTILSVPAVHNITGTLRSAVAAKGMFAMTKPLPAGSPVFALPMDGPNGLDLVWCAPKLNPDAKHWSAVCLPRVGFSFLWVPESRGLMPLSLNWDDDSVRDTNDAVIDEGPVDLPPLMIRYVFGGWTDQNWLKLTVTIDWGEGPQTLRDIALQPDAQGRVMLKVMGGQVALTPSGQGMVAVEQVAPIRPDGPIVF
jgi:hypothetical protein